MSAISEKIELLGKGMYANIPNELTLKSIPTASELEYVGAEDFDKTMIESILPQAVEEDINFYDLLELDYRWICRCLRIVNYGPYYTTQNIYCKECGTVSSGEYQVNLNTIACIPFPDGFVNDIKISRDEFIDFDGDVTLKLPTIRDILAAYKDKAFARKNGEVNRELARMCYMITSIGTQSALTPVDKKIIIQNNFSAADYRLLVSAINEVTNYGLRAGGTTICPSCGSKDAGFIALSDDRFFRPSVGDLKQWKSDKRQREMENTTRDKKREV